MTSIHHKDEYSFKKGDVVWAKVKGYPWWPGEICHITIKQAKTEPKDKQTIYRINFIGDNTHVDVPKAKVENFEDKYAKYSQIKKKKLQKAIDKAKRMIKEKESNVNNNKHSMERDLSVNEDEKKKNCLSDDDGDNDDNEVNVGGVNNGKKTTQYIGFKRFTKGKSNNKRNNNNNNSDKGNCNAHGSNNINISININVTNNNHNTLNISSFKSGVHTNETVNNVNTNTTNINTMNDVSSHNNDESESALSSSASVIEEEDLEERMKTLIENLLEYQIEVTNTSSHKCIINILNDIKELLVNKTFANLYELTKDIIPITHTFTYHKNHDIKMISTELLSLITSAIISEVFNTNNTIPSNSYINNTNNSSEPTIDTVFKQDIMNTINDNTKRNNIYTIPTNDIINALLYCNDTSIDNKREMKLEKKKSNDTSYNANTNNTNESKAHKEEMNTFNHNIDIDDKDFKFIYEDFVKVINNNNAVNMFDNISSDFYKNTYNKFNELDLVSSKKRKQVCLKLLTLLKKILIGVDVESLKKMIIFFEYKVRNEDPTFGKKYIQHIGSFYIKMKEIISGKDNKEIKVNDS